MADSAASKNASESSSVSGFAGAYAAVAVKAGV